MGFVNAKSTHLTIDDSAGAPRTLSSYLDSVDGLPGARALDDVTAFGDDGQRSIPGLYNGQFSIGGHWDSTATTGPHAVLTALALSATATSTFVYGPEGNAVGKPRLTGECWCSDFKITSKVGSKVSFTASFQIDGVVTSNAF